MIPFVLVHYLEASHMNVNKIKQSYGHSEVKITGVTPELSTVDDSWN